MMVRALREYIKASATRLLMALILCGYGAAILIRPGAAVGTVAFLQSEFGIQPLGMAFLFFAAGTAMSTRIHWLHYLAMLPLTVYSLASALFIIPQPNLTLVAVVQHAGLTALMWLLVEREWRAARGNNRHA